MSLHSKIIVVLFATGLTVGTVFFSTVAFASAWTGPTGIAPNNNTAAPLNVSSTGQSKPGSLAVGKSTAPLQTLDVAGTAWYNGLAVFGNTLPGGTASSSAYLNFGVTQGASGYGFWDNNGTLEYKNSGQSWTSVGSTGALTGPYLPVYAAWNSSGTGTGGAAIYNDNGTYKKLMVVGNNSASGLREVGIWDDLTVSNNLIVKGSETLSGSLAANGGLSASSLTATQNAADQLTLGTTATGNQAAIGFLSAGSNIWQMGKDTDNSFFVWDSVLSRTAIRIASQGNLSLMPNGGNVGINTASPAQTLDMQRQ